MATEQSPHGKQPPAVTTNPANISCRKKKSEEATFLEDVKDHIDEFIHASMDEHKTCFKKTIRRCLECQKLLQKGILPPRKLKALCHLKLSCPTSRSINLLWQLST